MEAECSNAILHQRIAASSIPVCLWLLVGKGSNHIWSYFSWHIWNWFRL